MRRILILGASNVTLAFPLIAAACISGRSSAPVELFAAHGHGRSFCKRSYVLHRGLPSIPECGIWEDLESRPPVEGQWALLTDIGNDLIYGVPVELIAERVEDCIGRIVASKMPLTYVPPPLERIQLLTERSYRVIKQILFPGPTVPWRQISRDIVQLNERITQVVQEAGGTIVQPELNWYGVDPIHIRPRRRAAAWQKILSSWSFPENPVVAWPGINRASQLWRLSPQERSYWARSYQNDQPALVDPDHSSYWLY